MQPDAWCCDRPRQRWMSGGEGGIPASAVPTAQPKLNMQCAVLLLMVQQCLPFQYRHLDRRASDGLRRHLGLHQACNVCKHPAGGQAFHDQTPCYMNHSRHVICPIRTYLRTRPPLRAPILQQMQNAFVTGGQRWDALSLPKRHTVPVYVCLLLLLLPATLVACPGSSLAKCDVRVQVWATY